MPSRANPYYTSGDTYGSRGLAPTGRLGGDSLALPLAQLAGSIAEAVTYDPNTDPRLSAMRKTNQEISQAKDRNTVLGQIGPSLADTSVPLADLAANAVGYGHMKPEEAGKIALLANAARGVQPGQDMDAALSGAGLYELAAGTPGSSTFNAGTFKARKDPTAVRGADGTVTLTAAEDSYGRTPVLSKEQVAGGMLGDLAASMTRPEKLAVTGAEPKQPDVYSYLGPNGESGSTTNPTAYAKPGWQVFKANVQSASPGGLNPAVKTDVQKADLAQKGFADLLDYTRQVAQKSPTLFGITGNARRIGQEVVQQLQNAKLMAPDQNVDTAFGDVLAKAKQNGVSIPGLDTYDPALNDIVKLSTILTYNAAEVFANQQGRSVSDKDVAKFQSLVGDPASFLSSQQNFLSGLDLMGNVLGLKQTRTDAALHPPAAGAAPAAAVPPAGAPQYQEGQTATGPDGTKLVFRNGQWVP